MPLKKAPSKSVAGLGIDLLNLSKVEQLFKNHQAKSLSRLFTPSERKKLIGAGAVRKAARLLAAKEAFFKASGASWLGPEGFRDIEVKGSQGSRFHVQSLTSADPHRGEGCFFEDGNFIGAQVILWKSS